MEPQQQHPHQQQQNHQLANDQDGGSNKSSSFLCRQSSTRWTPTTEQIRILKDLYYNNGVRSPSAEQIQKISAKLRQYGKIEGKNVFYWFQNHKARERQKKRLTTEIPMQRGVWRSEDPLYTKCPNLTSGAPSPSASSAGMHAVGHLGNYGYGSLAMERSFRDCSISPSGNGTGSMVHSFVWTGVDPYPSAYTFLDKKKCFDEILDEEQEEYAPQIETLPLFPDFPTIRMHGEEVSADFCSMKQETGSYCSCYQSDGNMGCSQPASLELTLRRPNSP